MPKALNPKATFPFVLEADRELPDGHPYKTVFNLRGLTIDEEEAVANSLFGGKMGSTELNVKSGSYQRVIIDKGLDGWENFNSVADDSDADWHQWDAKAIPFERNKGNPRGIKTELLDSLGSEARTELANAITSSGKVTAEEGNS